MPSSALKECDGYSILAFDSIRLNDQGKYWCEANSSEGWNRSASTSLTGIRVYKDTTLLLYIGCYCMRRTDITFLNKLLYGIHFNVHEKPGIFISVFDRTFFLLLSTTMTQYSVKSHHPIPRLSICSFSWVFLYN